MNYSKPAVSISDQITKLKNRGLTFNNETKAVSYLSNISYYRLRAYTYPFQDNLDPDHPFIIPISFEEIISLYIFDRKFRLLVMDAIEKIEVSMRTQIIYQWAMIHGSHWHHDNSLFRDTTKFINNNERLKQEVSRSKEDFISHYTSKYTNPSEPPCWMSLEVSSLGLLSVIFNNLKLGTEKRKVATYYGLNDVSILENWMHSFNGIRNICAHHGRLWNRRLTTHLKLPKRPNNQFIQSKTVLPYKVYGPLCCMKYILDIISPTHSFHKDLKKLLLEYPLAKPKEMGFPDFWEKEIFWQ
jgi:abortive infection bacteriophage resistance protein